MKPVWEILDDEVSRSVTIVEAMEIKINEALAEWGPEVLRTPSNKGGIAELYALYRQERTHLARTAKQSMDAGTAKLRVMQARTNAEAITRVLVYALDSAGLSEDLRALAVGALSEALALEGRGALVGEGSSAMDVGVIEGELMAEG